MSQLMRFIDIEIFRNFICMAIPLETKVPELWCLVYLHIKVASLLHAYGCVNHVFHHTSNLIGDSLSMYFCR